MSTAKSLDPAVSAMLREDLPVQLEQIHTALLSGKLAHARDLVHSVRGSAAFCKLDDLRDVSAKLENALINNDKNDPLVDAFTLEVNKIVAALDDNDK